MKENVTKQQLKKLGQYSVLAAAFMSTANQAQADAVFTDVDPDAVVTLGTPFIIDFDGDGVDDVAVAVGDFYGSAFGYVAPYQGSGAIAGTSFYAPYALNSGDAIDANLTFRTDGFQAQLYGSDALGPFIPGTNAYIGVRFNIGANTHFGWVQIVGVGPGEYNVLAHGYDDTPDATAIAGAMPVIPTMSEWGLISFALLMLSFGTIAIGRKKRIMPDGTTVDMGVAYEFRNPPFQVAYFKKAMLVTLGLVGLATTGTLLAYGSIAMVDVIGFTIAAPIFTYLTHLMMHQNNEWKKNQTK